MHIMVRAPLLSAALSIVCNWIIRRSLSRGPRPVCTTCGATAGGTARSRRCHPRGLPCSRRAPAAGRAAGVLAVTLMLDEALDLHRDGLVHLVGHDLASEGARRLLHFFVHFLAPARAF